jgi:hypothetical protein
LPPCLRAVWHRCDAGEAFTSGDVAAGSGVRRQKSRGTSRRERRDAHGWRTLTPMAVVVACRLSSLVRPSTLVACRTSSLYCDEPAERQLRIEIVCNVALMGESSANSHNSPQGHMKDTRRDAIRDVHRPHNHIEDFCIAIDEWPYTSWTALGCHRSHP